MSVFATFKKKEHFKVPNSQYIKTENDSAKEDTKPSDQPVKPAEPEAK
jgi:hypothetical protein